MLLRQCLVLFFLGFLIDLVQTIHIAACADRRKPMASATVVAVYLIGFVSHDWFVQHKSRRARWWITVAGGLGAGLGTWIALGE